MWQLPYRIDVELYIDFSQTLLSLHAKELQVF